MSPAAARSTSRTASRTAGRKATARPRKRAARSSPLGRRPLLRILALGVGGLVFLAHVSTSLTPALLNDLLGPAGRDSVYHVSMLVLFTLAYRLSFAPGTGRPAEADTAAALVCCAWGALCESVQNFIPARDFNFVELAINTLTPLAVVGLLATLRNWRSVVSW